MPFHPPTAAIVAGLAVLAPCAAGCGARVVLDQDAAARDAGATTEDAGDGAGGTCPDTTPPPSSSPPTQPGCYEDQGNGWVQVPCLCDLWIQNPTPAPAKVQLSLTMTPAAEQPTLAGPIDVEIAFDDGDSSWYAAWANQPGSGSAFAVTTGGGTTTVRLGTASLVLPPVVLSACERRDATAIVKGSFTETLKMQATLSDGGGNAVAAANGTCINPPHP